MILNIVLDLLRDGFFAGIAAIGFGAISNPPRKSFLYIAILAAFGHVLRTVLMKYFGEDLSTASFFAGLLIGFMVLPLARKSKMPTTVLYIPALLPMIPGKFAYNTIFSMILFVKSTSNSELQNVYMSKIFSNGLIAIVTIFFLAVGATLPVFFFPEKAYTMTRRKFK